MEKLKKTVSIDNLVEAFDVYDYDAYKVEFEENVPIYEFSALADKIVNSTMIVDGKFVQDTVKLDVMKILIFLDKYSNVSINMADSSNEYNKLLESHGGNIIFGYFIANNPACIAFNNIVNSKVDDLRVNYQMNLLNAINSSTSFVLGGISKVLGAIEESIGNLDEEDFKAILNRLKG